MPSERELLRHVRPLWHEEAEHAELTPFLEEIKPPYLLFKAETIELKS